MDFTNFEGFVIPSRCMHAHERMKGRGISPNHGDACLWGGVGE
jgi:hypothetical protein